MVPPFILFIMKTKIVLFVFGLMILTSCFRSYVNVGMDNDTSSRCVKTISHHHLFGGFINISGDDDMYYYIGGQNRFQIKTYFSVWDILLASFTAGIYTPCTTKIYLPD